MNKCYACGNWNRDDVDICVDCGTRMFDKGKDLRKGKFEHKERGYD